MDLENNIDLNISAKGRNKIYRKSPNLFRGIITLFETHVCDCHLNQKDKIKFVQQFFTWFYKSPITFNIEPVLKYGSKGKLVDSDFIIVNASVKFIFIKKLFSILNLKILDEKKIKKRKYTVLFIIYISDIKKYNNEVLLDINSNKYGYIKVLMVLNSYYIKDIMQLIFYYYKNLIL